MGKKKTVTVTTQERELPDEDTEIKTLEPPDDSEGLDGVLGLAADGERITVHKEPSAPGGKRAYCATFTRDELSLDVIRDRFGGGDYRLTAFDSDNKLADSKRVTIIDVPKPAQELVPREPRGDNNQALLLEMIRSQGAMVAALLARPAPAPAAASGPTAMELVQLIKALQPDAPDKSPTEILLEGLKMGRELGGGGDTDMLSIAAKGLDVLGPIIAAQAGKAKAPPAPAAIVAPRQPAPNPPLHPEQPTEQPSAEQMDILKKLQWLRATVAHFTGYAAKGKRPDGSWVKDPELYADVFMDNLPDIVTPDEIYERMIAKDAVAQLVQVHPPAGQYLDWFEGFRRAVLDSFEPEGEDTGEADEPTGDIEP